MLTLAAAVSNNDNGVKGKKQKRPIYQYCSSFYCHYYYYYYYYYYYVDFSCSCV